MGACGVCAGEDLVSGGQEAGPTQLKEERVMSGIGSVNVSVVAGGEAAKQDQLRKARLRGTKRVPVHQKASASDIKDFSLAQLLELAKGIVESDSAVRPEVVECIRARLEQGDYKNREVIEELARKLLDLFETVEAP
jgi:hypothetical protein